MYIAFLGALMFWHSRKKCRRVATPVQGYHYIGKTRNHMTLKRSGGIGVFIKDYLFKAVESIECACYYLIRVDRYQV